MKNKNNLKLLYIKLALLIVVLFSIIALLALTFNGFSIDMISSSLLRANLGNYTLVENEVVLPTNDISSIRVELSGGNINIEGYNKEGITFTYTDSKNVDAYYIVEGGKLRIKLNPSVFVADYNTYDGNINMFVPNGLLHKLEVSTVAGDINISSYGSSLNLKTIAGDVKILDGYKYTNISSVSGTVTLNPRLEYLDNFNFSTVSGNCYVMGEKINYSTNFTSVNGKMSDKAVKDLRADKFKINYNSIDGNLFIEN